MHACVPSLVSDVFQCKNTLQTAGASRSVRCLPPTTVASPRGGAPVHVFRLFFFFRIIFSVKVQIIDQV